MMAAIKGYSFKSPRGTVTVDPNTRELIQTDYVTQVQKVNGQLTNVVLKGFPDVKDPWHELHSAGKPAK
jgi:branched-chain amino acid transport system substrate-binding protein